MACANHEARRLPLWFFHFFCVGGSAPHIICLPLVHSILPKRGRSTKDCSELLQLLPALRIWNRPPFICHIPLVSLHDFFHDKHQIPSMCSARRLHAHVHALSTNKSQLVAPHMLNSFGNPIGSPNEDRLRTFHHNLRHGCQTKLTSLHKNKVEPTVLAAVCQIKQKTRCHPQDSVGANMNSCYPDLCMHIYLGHIFLTFCLTYLLTFFLTYLLTFFLTSFWHIFWHSFWHIFWHSFWWHIFWHIFLTFFLTFLSPFFLTYLLTLFLTYLLTFFLTYLLTYLLTFFLTYLLIYLLTFFLTYLLAFFLTYLPIFFLASFWHIFWHSVWHIFWHSFWHIFWHSFWRIFWHSFWHIFLTYLLTFFLTYLLTFFLTYLLTFFRTYLSPFFLTYLLGILFDISFWHISWHSSWHIFLTFFLTYLLTFFLTYLLTFFLTYLLTFILTYLLTFFLTYSFWHSFWHLSDISFDILSDIPSDISFWHFFGHIFWHSFWHIFCHSFWQIFWHNTWGPARHTERLGSGTPHWTHRIAVGVRDATLNWSGTPHWTHELAVEVRHATLNSRARGWGPARHTELTRSWLRSDAPHWTHKIVVEVRQGDGGRRRKRRRRRRRSAGEETDIKSNNPHLTGGEKNRSTHRCDMYCKARFTCSGHKMIVKLLNSLTWTIYITKNSQKKKTPTLPIYRLTNTTKPPSWISSNLALVSCVFHHPKKKTNNRAPLGKSHHGHLRRFPRRICIGRLISGELRVGQEAPGKAASLVWMGLLHPWKNGQNEFVPPKKRGIFSIGQIDIWTNHWFYENMFRKQGSICDCP